jgi:hypothetical protein
MDVKGHCCVSVRIGFIGLRTDTDSTFVLHFGSFIITYVVTERKTQKQDENLRTVSRVHKTYST